MKYIDKIKYNEEGKKLLDEAMVDIQNGVWIGEDGGATCSAKNKREAHKTFVQLMKDDVGEEEAKEVHINDVGIGWLQLWQEHEYKGDCDNTWYVSYTIESDYEVFVYQP